jgi:hypothetical protein
MHKLKSIWELIWSYSYVVLTDKNAVIHIPMMDPSKIQDIMILGSQKSSLKEFRYQLDEVIKEHDRQTKLLLHRKRNARNKV